MSSCGFLFILNSSWRSSFVLFLCLFILLSTPQLSAAANPSPPPFPTSPLFVLFFFTSPPLLSSFCPFASLNFLFLLLLFPFSFPLSYLSLLPSLHQPRGTNGSFKKGPSGLSPSFSPPSLPSVSPLPSPLLPLVTFHLAILLPFCKERQDVPDAPPQDPPQWE